MKSTRLIALFMASIMVFAACSRSQKAEESSSSSAETSQESETEEAPVQEEEPEEELPQTARSEEFSRALGKMGQIYDPALSVLNVLDSSLKESPEPKNYTVMIYMIGSNLESINAAGTSDLLEIESSGIDYSRNNVLVYAGGSRRWFTDIPGDRNAILDMSRDADDRIVAETEGNADMGADSTLSYFLDFSTTYYPSDHYMLIFWDHGGGPILGYGSDELFSNDSLLLSEMESAMNSTQFRSRKLDIVGFDACLMGCLENMSVWSDYADYYIASEELEPGDGWNYDFLSILNEDVTPQEIGSHVLDCYESHYAAKRSDVYNPDLTLSLIDLSKIGSVISAVNDLSDSMKTDLKGNGFISISRSRADTKSFGYIAPSEDSSDATYYDLADLGDLAEQLSESYPSQSQKLKTALEQMVVDHYASVENTSGASIYFPSMNKWMYLGARDLLRNSSVSDTYHELINSYSSIWCRSKERDWTIEAPVESTDSYTIQLTEDQLSNGVSFYYTVLDMLETNKYAPILTHICLTPDENGQITIPKDPKILTIDPDFTGDKTLYQYWPADITEDSRTRTVYHLLNTRVADSMDFSIWNEEQIRSSVDITAYTKAGSDDVHILDIRSSAYGVGTVGKDTIDLNNWESFLHILQAYLPTVDTQGRPKPYTEWQSSYFSYGFYPIESSLSFEKHLLSETKGSFYAQLIIEDGNGEQYASSLMKLTDTRSREQAKVYTDAGMMTFDLYEDHAALVGYSGSDTSLVVPEEAEGLPVTEIHNMNNDMLAGSFDVTEITLPDTIDLIGENAFYHFTKLESINLPSGLKKIGFRAFSNTSISSITIPDTVTSIGMNAFSFCTRLSSVDLPENLEQLSKSPFMGCSSLEEITIAGSKTKSISCCQIIDGVLYSPDGKELINYPGAKGDSYTVADGTESIGLGAFMNNSTLKEVFFPDSLTSIGNYSFYGCTSLQAPTLPDGLTFIGRNAFGAQNYTLPLGNTIPQQTIRIPSQVKFIGFTAFDLFPSRVFEVDPENAYYASLDGALTNAAKDSLHQPASDGSGLLVIPEGIRYFDWANVDILDNYIISYDQPYEVVLPSTITQFPADDYSGTNPLLFHCPIGSPAETYAFEQEIPYDSVLDQHYTMYEETVDNAVWSYRLYQDHAMLVSVMSEPDLVSFEIPETIQGLPVTILGNGYGSVAPGYEDPTFGSNSTLEEVKIPETVTTINSNAFGTCYALKRINLPEHLEVIGNKAFNSASLTLPPLPETLVSLGDTFSVGEQAFETFPISKDLTHIAPSAFSRLAHIQRFEADPDNPAFYTDDGVLFNNEGTTLWAFPSGRSGDYTVPEGISLIGPYSFSLSSINNVTLPSSVTRIDEFAFSQATDLQTISFGEGLETIGVDAFYFCTSLSSVHLPASVRIIENSAFRACQGLTDLKLNEGLAIIEDGAFSGIGMSPMPDLPDSLTVIGPATFDYSYNLEDTEPYTLRIGPNISDISSWAFKNRKIIGYEVDPENSRYSSLDGFLTDLSQTIVVACPPYVDGAIHVPDGIWLLDTYSFYGVVGLTDLYIPDSVISINDINLPYQYETDEETGETIHIYPTIHCSSGSAAERYALENDLPYVIE